jgi:hypothetical protein
VLFVYSVLKNKIKVMKIEKSIIAPRWAQIKEMYEAGTNGSDRYGKNFEIGGELDVLSLELIEILGEITHKLGFNCVVEDVKLDLWKERVWCLIENAELLPEIAWRDDKESDRLEAEDKWNSHNDEFDYDFKSKEHEAYEF